MLMIHGYGDSQNLLRLADSMANKGFFVVLFDLNGFGYSCGSRFNARKEEIELSFQKFLYMMNKKKPVFVFSEGYGATFFIDFIIKSQINISGLILSSPWLEIPTQLYEGNRFKLFLIRNFGWLFKELLLINFVSSSFIYQKAESMWRNKHNSFEITFFGV